MSIVPLYVPAHVGITYFPHMWPDIQKETENNNSSPNRSSICHAIFVIRLQKNLYLTEQMGH